VACHSANLTPSAAVSVESSDGAAAWSIESATLPPASAHPPVCLCVLESAGARDGNVPKLPRMTRRLW
jgi:hypothetical protein